MILRLAGMSVLALLLPAMLTAQSDDRRLPGEDANLSGSGETESRTSRTVTPQAQPTRTSLRVREGTCDQFYRDLTVTEDNEFDLTTRLEYSEEADLKGFFRYCPVARGYTLDFYYQTLDNRIFTILLVPKARFSTGNTITTDNFRIDLYLSGRTLRMSEVYSGQQRQAAVLYHPDGKPAWHEIHHGDRRFLILYRGTRPALVLEFSADGGVSQRIYEWQTDTYRSIRIGPDREILSTSEWTDAEDFNLNLWPDAENATSIRLSQLNNLLAAIPAGYSEEQPALPRAALMRKPMYTEEEEEQEDSVGERLIGGSSSGNDED